MRWPVRTLASLALLAGLVAPMSASAFVRNTVPKTDICFFWDKRNIPWVMNDQGASSVGPEKTQVALRKAFASWADVACSDLAFTEERPTPDAKIGFNQDKGAANTNLLVFRREVCDDVVPTRDPCWTRKDCPNTWNCWDFSLNTIAVTTTTYRPDTGQILDSDIEFNEAVFLFTTVDSPKCEQGNESVNCVATDIWNTATHEVGHLIGLDHTDTPQSQQATMLAKAAPGDTFMRTLAQDDIDGICTIYPAGKPTSVCVDRTGDGLDGNEGCGGCASGGAATSLIWGGLALAWAATRTRRE